MSGPSSPEWRALSWALNQDDVYADIAEYNTGDATDAVIAHLTERGFEVAPTAYLRWVGETVDRLHGQPVRVGEPDEAWFYNKADGKFEPILDFDPAATPAGEFAAFDDLVAGKPMADDLQLHSYGVNDVRWRPAALARLRWRVWRYTRALRRQFPEASIRWFRLKR